MSSTNEETKSEEQNLRGHHDHGHRHHHYRRRRWKMPFIIVAAVLAKSALIFVLWNHLIPDIFQGPQISYVQAIGLMILAKLLIGFGGFGGFRHHRHHGWRKHWLANLSPEEREKFKERIFKNCK